MLLYLSKVLYLSIWCCMRCLYGAVWDIYMLLYEISIWCCMYMLLNCGMHITLYTLYSCLLCISMLLDASWCALIMWVSRLLRVQALHLHLSHMIHVHASLDHSCACLSIIHERHHVHASWSFMCMPLDAYYMNTCIHEYILLDREIA